MFSCSVGLTHCERSNDETSSASGRSLSAVSLLSQGATVWRHVTLPCDVTVMAPLPRPVKPPPVLIRMVQDPSASETWSEGVDGTVWPALCQATASTTAIAP